MQKSCTVSDRHSPETDVLRVCQRLQHIQTVKQITTQRNKDMKIKEGYVIRKVMGNHVVIATGAQSKYFHGMVKLNNTAAEIWELIAKGLDENGIVAAMLESYDVEEEKLRADVQKTVNTLVEQGFVEV